MTTSPNLILIVGIPGVGKTTLVNSLLALLEETPAMLKNGLVFGENYLKYRMFLFGSYSCQEVFSGTDRFSMQVQKDIPAFWQWILPNYQNWNFVGEGSRISTNAFIEEAIRQKLSLKILHLVTSDSISKIRRETRSKQNPIWVKGMITRITNLTNTYRVFVEERENSTFAQLDQNAHYLFHLLEDNRYASGK